jgi:hypothetical protein
MALIGKQTGNLAVGPRDVRYAFFGRGIREQIQNIQIKGGFCSSQE